MQILIDIPDRLVDNEFGYVDVRFHKDGKHINHVTTCDYEFPYFAELPFIVLPKGHGRLIDADDFFDEFSEIAVEPYINATTVLEADKDSDTERY